MERGVDGLVCPYGPTSFFGDGPENARERWGGEAALFFGMVRCSDYLSSVFVSLSLSLSTWMWQPLARNCSHTQAFVDDWTSAERKSGRTS